MCVSKGQLLTSECCTQWNKYAHNSSFTEYKFKVEYKALHKTDKREEYNTDELIRTAIRRKEHCFYFINSTLTIGKILAFVSDNPDLHDFREHFCTNCWRT